MGKQPGCEITLPRVETLKERYERHSFALLPGLLSPRDAAMMLKSTENTPSHRVRCGQGNIQWDEQQFSSGDLAYEFFKKESVMRLVKALMASGRIEGLMCWTSCYRTGEYIDPHRDQSGKIQLLVCLEAPPSEEYGGVLHVGGSGFFLSPGDAVVFSATTLEHYTTPLVASDSCPEPRRIVLVGRYYL